MDDCKLVTATVDDCKISEMTHEILEIHSVSKIDRPLDYYNYNIYQASNFDNFWQKYGRES